MKDKIIVQNNVRVGNFINTKLEHNDDLLSNNDPKVRNFLNNYSKYLNSYEEDEMLDFFKLTGLLIGHEIIEKGTFKRIYFSLMGPYSHDYIEVDSKPEAYNNHLIIETYVDKLEVCKNNIIVNTNIIYYFKKKKEIGNSEHKYNISNMNIKEQINYLKENNYLLPNTNDIKRILIDPFYNVISLTNKGCLYINDYLYSEGVDYIFELNTKDIKLIYKNRFIEEYSNHYNSLTSQKYDKIIYDENFLAILKDSELLLYLIFELDCNQSMYLRFMGVDDIECTKKGNSLWDRYIIIKKNHAEIKLPLGSIMLMS